ncbi:MAG: OmpA family protein [Deltaproteobacteria bacterium]|nr:MAG: OmpA family protein [Deltaproteobacteria bacterium]
MVKKKTDTDDAPRVNVGLVMTICLFLILLTFFILLNSIAVIDERRKIMAIGSLLGAFGSFHGGVSPLKTGESIMPLSAPMIEAKLDVEELLAVMDKRTVGQIKIESSMDREIITINEKVLFDKNKSKLRSSSYPLLDKLSELIKKGDYPVEIVGHTDNRPAKEKGYKSNWELSTLMAIQALRYFVEKGKVPDERLTAYGSGSYRPIASNDTRQSRAQNRRVDMILHYEMPAYVKRIYRKKPRGVFTYKRFDFKVF